jgi:hypothetical protein
MTKTLLLGIVLVAFGAFTLEALASYGIVGYFETLLSTLPGVHATTDLVIALALALVWMAADARERALPFWPYAIGCLFLGSIGPLAYLVHRELRARAPRKVAA